MAACKTEDEKKRTADLIRPILRGRDIKRYSYQWANLWLINTHNGIKEKGIPRIKIEDYPTVKKYLDSYWTEIEKRADQGDTPYNLRNCAYMDDFSQQKIVYPDIMRLPKNKERMSQYPYFYLDNEGYYPEATLFMMNGKKLDEIFYFLSSDIGFYVFSKFYMGPVFDNTGFRYKKEYLLNLPVPDFVLGNIQNYEKRLAMELDLTQQEVNEINSYKNNLLL